MSISYDVPSLPRELVYRSVGAGYVALRPLRASDARGLRALIRSLSPESRYRRFHSSIVDLAPAAAQVLSDVDQDSHVAWGAFASESIGGAEGILVAEARFIRHADRPRAAELGIAVLDAWQRKGVGSALMGQLFRDARARGIGRITAEVVYGNAALILLLSRFGTVRVIGERTVEIDVTAPP